VLKYIAHTSPQLKLLSEPVPETPRPPPIAIELVSPAMPKVAVPFALRDVVIFARGRGFSRVVFEVDSEDLVRLWNNRVKVL
jgi:hypothetical protein